MDANVCEKKVSPAASWSFWTTCHDFGPRFFTLMNKKEFATLTTTTLFHETWQFFRTKKWACSTVSCCCCLPSSLHNRCLLWGRGSCRRKNVYIFEEDVLRLLGYIFDRTGEEDLLCKYEEAKDHHHFIVNPLYLPLPKIPRNPPETPPKKKINMLFVDRWIPLSFLPVVSSVSGYYIKWWREDMIWWLCTNDPRFAKNEMGPCLGDLGVELQRRNSGKWLLGFSNRMEWKCESLDFSTFYTHTTHPSTHPRKTSAHTWWCIFLPGICPNFTFPAPSFLPSFLPLLSLVLSLIRPKFREKASRIFK